MPKHLKIQQKSFINSKLARPYYFAIVLLILRFRKVTPGNNAQKE